MSMELRGALIGCGFFAANHLHAWRDISGATIVAICDRNTERLADYGNKFGIQSRYTDAADLFAREKLDFVDIATTVDTHRVLVEMAAQHRVPVICQKPFARSMEDAQAMVRACAAAGVPLMVHENFRWQTPIQAVADVITSGRIGRPFFARVSFRSAYDVFSSQPYLAKGERFIIEDLGIHILDIARFLLGDAIRITGSTQRVNQTICGEDVATMLLDHASGATSVVDCSYATRLAAEPFPETLVEVDGSEGSIRLGQGYQMVVTSREGVEIKNVEPVLLPWATRPWHNIQESVFAIQSHWIECLRQQREPATSGRDNLRTLGLVEAAYQSAAASQTIDLAIK
jgi:D-apiose dehydrogenase